jgi:hygromycin-B 7''-O-kinase
MAGTKPRGDFSQSSDAPAHCGRELAVTKRLFPEAPNAEAFERVWRDDAAFSDGVRCIAETLGVNARAERFAGGSLPVYALGPELVLKLYPPFYTGEAAREAAFLAVLDQQLPISTPKLHALGALDGWDYVLMSRLRGEPLVTVLPELSRADQRRLSTKLGEALRVLHALRDERLEPTRVEWRAFVQTQKSKTLALQEKRHLAPRWLEQIPDFLDAECGALEAAVADSPLHTEVMREHLLVERVNGAYELSGLFDFEPAMIGAPEYEFASVGVFFSCGDPVLLRDVLVAYGYSHPDLNHALERRLLTYALLHCYSNLAWYLDRIPPNENVTRLDELAAHFFGIDAGVGRGE